MLRLLFFFIRPVRFPWFHLVAMQRMLQLHPRKMVIKNIKFSAPASGHKQKPFWVGDGDGAFFFLCGIREPIRAVGDWRGGQHKLDFHITSPIFLLFFFAVDPIALRASSHTFRRVVISGLWASKFYFSRFHMTRFDWAGRSEQLFFFVVGSLRAFHPSTKRHPGSEQVRGWQSCTEQRGKHDGLTRRGREREKETDWKNINRRSAIEMYLFSVWLQFRRLLTFLIIAPNE